MVTPFALFIVRLLRFAMLDGIFTPLDDPPKVSDDEAVVPRFEGVPAIVGPLRVSVFAPTENIPEVRVSTPPVASVRLLFNETPFALFIVRLFRFVMLDGMFTLLDDPPKTSDDEAEVVRFAGVPAIGGPLRERVFAPTENVPEVRESVPAITIFPEAEALLPEIMRL
jgi:hypothetical protein